MDLTFSLQQEFLPKTSVLLSGIRSKLLFAQIPLLNLFPMTFIGSKNIPQLANNTNRHLEEENMIKFSCFEQMTLLSTSFPGLFPLKLGGKGPGKEAAFLFEKAGCSSKRDQDPVL